MYSEILLDHYQTPRNQGPLEHSTGQARRVNPVCGDVLSLWIRVDTEGKLEQLSCQAAGCAPAVAAISYLTEWAQGKTPAEAASLSPQQLAAMLGGLPPNKFHAVTLAVDVLRAVCSSHAISL